MMLAVVDLVLRRLPRCRGDIEGAGAAGLMAEAHYRIGTVARLSGLSTHVIRVWERRYAVLAPDRTPGGARSTTMTTTSRDCGS